MDPLTLALIIGGASAGAAKLGGAKTSDALKQGILSGGLSFINPASAASNPFAQAFAQESGKSGIKSLLLETVKQGLMQQAGKKLGVSPLLLNAGLSIGQSFLPQNLTQSLTASEAFPGMSPSEIINQSTQYGSIPADMEGGAEDVASILRQAQVPTTVPTTPFSVPPTIPTTVPTTPGFDIDSTYTGGEFDIAKVTGGGGGLDKVKPEWYESLYKTYNKDTGQYELDVNKMAKIGTLVGVPATLLATGAFKPKPTTMYQPTYNINYPKLREARGPMKRIDPATGKTVEVAMTAYPEASYASSEPYAWSEKTFYPKEYNQGGLASIQKFNEGGMSKLPSKISHDENDINNYMRVNGYIEDHNGHKDEDTLLAQLADGEFVTRTDGVLGAGIIAGANPKNEKEMRQKGAKFFYEQQKRFKRVFDLLNENRARKLH